MHMYGRSVHSVSIPMAWVVDSTTKAKYASLAELFFGRKQVDSYELSLLKAVAAPKSYDFSSGASYLLTQYVRGSVICVV